MFIIALNIFFKNFQGIAIYPFIILKNKTLKDDKRIVNHEKIHLRQQIEMLWIFFFLWYGTEFMIRWIQTKNAHQAYLKISFEKEAYQNEYDFNYLKERTFWTFLNYL